jgi:hypothetical protein
MRLSRRQLRKMILKEMRVGDMMGGRASSVRFDLPGGDSNVYPQMFGGIESLIEEMRQFYMQSHRPEGHRLPSGDYGGEMHRGFVQQAAQKASVGFAKLADDLEKALTDLQSSLAQTSGMQADAKPLLKLLAYVPRVCESYKRASRQPRHQFCDRITQDAIVLIKMTKGVFGV